MYVCVVHEKTKTNENDDNLLKNRGSAVDYYTL